MDLLIIIGDCLIIYLFDIVKRLSNVINKHKKMSNVIIN